MSKGLSAEGVALSRDGRPVIRDMSLDLRDGEMVALLGANGSGKTTLLRILLGLLKPQAGRVLLDGKPIESFSRRVIARRIAYVPQRHQPSFPFSVAEIVAMGRVSTTGWARPSPRVQAEVMDAIERVGIGHLADRAYTGLSGGEQQAALIARALAQRADILLLDEPTAALDPGQAVRVVELLQELVAEGFTVLATTHDPAQAWRAFGRALVLVDGRIIADGPGTQVLTAETVSRCYGVDFILEPMMGISRARR